MPRVSGKGASKPSAAGPSKAAAPAEAALDPVEAQAPADPALGPSVTLQARAAGHWLGAPPQDEGAALGVVRCAAGLSVHTLSNAAKHGKVRLEAHPEIGGASVRSVSAFSCGGESYPAGVQVAVIDSVAKGFPLALLLPSLVHGLSRVAADG